MIEALTKCQVSLTGSCLRALRAETPCALGDGECAHGGRPLPRTRIEIDLNARISATLTPAWRKDADGPVETGDHVIVFEPESAVCAPAEIVDVKPGGLLHLSVDWSQLTNDPTPKGTP